MAGAVFRGFGDGNGMLAGLSCDNGGGLASVQEYVESFRCLTDAQAAAMQAFFQLERERVVAGVSSVGLSSGSSDEEQPGLLVECPEPRSEVSVRSSVSSARARKRARARARKAKAAQESVASYTPPAGVPDPVGDFCYAQLISPERRAQVMSEVGPRPSFESILSLSCDVVHPAWGQMRVSGRDGVFHLSDQGTVLAAHCLHTVAVRRLSWPSDSFGQVAAAMRVDLPSVYYDKAPLLSDKLAGPLESAPWGDGVLAASRVGAFQQLVASMTTPAVVTDMSSLAAVESEGASMLLWMQGSKAYACLPVAEAAKRPLGRSSVSVCDPEPGVAAVLLAAPVQVPSRLLVSPERLAELLSRVALFDDTWKPRSAKDGLDDLLVFVDEALRVWPPAVALRARSALGI